MAKKLRLGMLGAGPRARSLMPVYMSREGVEIAAVCDLYQRNIDKTLSQVKGLDGVKTYLDYEKMVADCPLDALMITISPFEQVRYACDAMERGLHVMTEVPCALSAGDCRNLVAAVKKTGCIYQLAEQTRYMHFITEWRRMYGEGVFGHIVLMEGEYLHYERWDNYVDLDTGEMFYNKDTLERAYSDPNAGGGDGAGNGAGVDAGARPEGAGRRLAETWRFRCMAHPIYYLPHELSPLLSITDDRIVSVSCMGTRRGSYSDPVTLPDSRDIEVALMKSEKGTLYRLMAGFTSQHGHRSGTGCHWYHVKGAKAAAEWTRNTVDPPRMWTPADGWREAGWTLADPDAPDAAKASGHGGLDWYPIDEFASAIEEKRAPWLDVYRAVDTALPAILAAESADMDGALIEVPNPRDW